MTLGVQPTGAGGPQNAFLTLDGIATSGPIVPGGGGSNAGNCPILSLDPSTLVGTPTGLPAVNVGVRLYPPRAGFNVTGLERGISTGIFRTRYFIFFGPQQSPQYLVEDPQHPGQSLPGYDGCAFETDPLDALHPSNGLPPRWAWVEGQYNPNPSPLAGRFGASTFSVSSPQWVIGIPQELKGTHKAQWIGFLYYKPLAGGTETWLNNYAFIGAPFDITIGE